MLILNLRRRLLAITATAIRDRAVATGDYPEAGAPSRIPLRAYLSAREIREPDFEATQLPTHFPFRTNPSLVRPAKRLLSTRGGIRLVYCGDIRAAPSHDAPPGPESPGIRGSCKTHSIPAVVVTAITSRTEKREFRRKHRPMRTLDTD